MSTCRPPTALVAHRVEAILLVKAASRDEARAHAQRRLCEWFGEDAAAGQTLPVGSLVYFRLSSESDLDRRFRLSGALEGKGVEAMHAAVDWDLLLPYVDEDELSLE